MLANVCMNCKYVCVVEYFILWIEFIRTSVIMAGNSATLLFTLCTGVLVFGKYKWFWWGSKTLLQGTQSNCQSTLWSNLTGVSLLGGGYFRYVHIRLVTCHISHSGVSYVWHTLTARFFPFCPKTPSNNHSNSVEISVCILEPVHVGWQCCCSCCYCLEACISGISLNDFVVMDVISPAMWLFYKETHVAEVLALVWQAREYLFIQWRTTCFSVVDRVLFQNQAIPTSEQTQIVNAIRSVFKNGYSFSIYTGEYLTSLSIILLGTSDLMV